MTVYLLIDKNNNDVVGVYKYECVAMRNASRPSLKESLNNIFNGGKSAREYRVEVYELIE